MKTINYTGSSKIIKRIVHLLNRKAPLPLNGDGDAVWGANGQVLTTDGQGGTSWKDVGGGDVTDVEVNGTSVVNAQGVAEVTVPTNTSDLNNDSGFIDGTDLSTALSGYTPTANLANVATSGDYDDLLNKPSIPTVGDGTITIQKNGTTVDTFTTNQSANKTVNITVTEGHTIWNRIKTALTSRAALWFADASVSDDSADGATKVEVVTELASENAFDALATDGTADGVYCFPDSGAEYLTADNVGYDGTSSGLSALDVQDAIDAVEGQIANSSDAYSTSKAYSVGNYCIYNDTLYKCITACTAASWSVNSSCFVADTVVSAINGRGSSSVVADGIQTFAQILGSLSSIVDRDKISHHAILVEDQSTFIKYYWLDLIQGNQVVFARMTISISASFYEVLGIDTSGFAYRSHNTGTIENRSNDVPASGSIFTIYY